jgi:hypothetical protein
VATSIWSRTTTILSELEEPEVTNCSDFATGECLTPYR